MPGRFLGLPPVPSTLDAHQPPTPPGAGEAAAELATARELREALRAAARVLSASGIASPRADAELLAGHLLGEDRGRVAVSALMGSPVPAGYAELVARRAARVPLQHLTGSAPFRALSLAVGPGVFVPRPETELVAQAAIDEAARLVAAGAAPLVLDLCTGSGAIAASVAHEVPGAVVHAVEIERAAHTYAARNLAGTEVTLHLGDALALPEGLEGAVDVVVSNPPYVPPREHADPEVGRYDPATALYGGGADGMDFPRALAARAARLLKPGGLFVMEHDETQGEAVLGLLSAPGWVNAVVHRDLAGRERYAVARRAEAGAGRGSRAGVGE